MKYIFLCMLSILSSSAWADIVAAVKPKPHQQQLQNESALQADPDNSSSSKNHHFKQMTPEFLYSYIDFDFNSTTGANFNRYQGRSNLYSIGADHISVSPDLTGGFYLLNVQTRVHSQFQAFPVPLTSSTQSIHNHTLYGHLRKSFTPRFDVDIAGGYGQNRIHSQTRLLTHTPNQNRSFAKYHNDNWLVSVNGIYKKQWHKLLLRAYVGALYSQINTGRYSLSFAAFRSPQTIAALSTKTTYVIEGAELSYRPASELSTFINGGLVQVADYRNSRAVFVQPIIGTLPQLNMDRNGYKLGGGLVYRHKQITLRLEEKYYRADNLFRSYQTIAGLEYRFS